MEFITPKEAADNWEISIRRVQKYCADGKIDGAVNMGKQWLIPSDAQRPPDGRKNRSEGMKPDPFFPLFIYTRDLSSPETANVPESLLKPALLFLEGKYSEAVPSFRKLSAEGSNRNIRFSATVFLAFSAILLGMTDEYRAGLVSLQAMMTDEKEQDEYKEEYNLCYRFMQCFVSYDLELLRTVDPIKLSDEALAFYSLSLLMTQSFTANKQSQDAMAAYELLCRTMERKKAFFGLMCLSTLLGIQYFREQDIDHAEEHAKKACELALRNDWLPALAIVYPAMTSVFNKFLIWEGHNYILEIRKHSEQICSSMAILHTASGGDFERMKTALTEGCQMLHLLAYGLTNRDIGNVMDIPDGVVKRKIQALMEQYGVQNRAELVKQAKKQYSVG